MPISHIVGFDDAPCDRSHRGDVLVVGAVHSGAHLLVGGIGAGESRGRT